MSVNICPSEFLNSLCTLTLFLNAHHIVCMSLEGKLVKHSSNNISRFKPRVIDHQRQCGDARSFCLKRRSSALSQLGVSSGRVVQRHDGQWQRAITQTDVRSRAQLLQPQSQRHGGTRSRLSFIHDLYDLIRLKARPQGQLAVTI